MLRSAIPLLHVSSTAAAEEFFCKQLGFALQFAYRPDEARADPCFMGLARDGVSLHVSSFAGDGVAGGVASFMVDDVDGLYAEFIARQVAVALPPTDQTWGNREMYVKDADGNSLRYIQAPGHMSSGPALAARLPDIPRWVEARHLLLSGTGEIFGLQEAPELALAVRDPEGGLVIVIGRPALCAVEAAVAAGDEGELITPPENGDWAARALPGWRRSRVFLHSLAEPQRLPETGAGEAGFLDPARVAVLAVSDELRGELESAARYSPIAAAFVEGEAVAFCYAGSETERLWDVSIDTVPAHRRQGWAGKAAAYMIRHMWAKGKQPVWAAVDENPASWRLAQKIGFTQVDEIVLFTRPGDKV